MHPCDIVQRRSAGIGGIGEMDTTSGQPPNQKAVDGADRNVPARAHRGRPDT